MISTPHPPSLWADIKAMERFPFAAVASRLNSPQARDLFASRVGRDNANVCPHQTLRGLLRESR